MPPSLSPSLRSTPARSVRLIGNPISHRSHHRPRNSTIFFDFNLLHRTKQSV
ncbi:unnamed protein product [Brassica oleracea]|uniref:Uncharacterized protein n=2 Tax=Brassica TaxID=3705 RepID=A0A3P6DMV1_BRAOL|nr:unnamed protein product [Brassica napus]VDD27778.1 unnamed protein product [Brassica oleracea]